MSETVTTAKQWYVVHTYSGFENKVKEAIESRAKIFGMAERITRVLVPTEKVVEVRRGRKMSGGGSIINWQPRGLRHWPAARKYTRQNVSAITRH